MSTPPISITPPTALKKKAAPLAKAIGKAKAAAPQLNVPGKPSVRQQEQDQGNWMNDPKVATRTTETI